MAAPYTVVLATVTVSGSPVSSINFTSIDQSYAHLMIVGSMRSTRASNSSSIGCYVNGDTNTANYDYSRNYYVSGSNFSCDAGSLSVIGYAAGATTPSATFSSVEIFVGNYSTASRHYLGGKTGFGDSVTVANSRWSHTGLQHAITTNPVTALSIYDLDATLDIGSTLTLLGIKDS